MQHTCLYISLPLFRKTKNVKLPSHSLYGGNVRVPVHFIFSLPLIFTLVAASISHFLTAAIKFLCFLPTKLVSVVLFLAPAFPLLPTLMKTLKFSRKKDWAGFFVFFSWRVGAAMRLTAETSEVLEMQNFTSKRPVFHLNPRDGHAVSLRYLLADAWFWQLSIHLHTDGLYNWQDSVNFCKILCDTWNRLTCSVRTGGRTQTSWPNFHYQIFLAMHGASLGAQAAPLRKFTRKIFQKPAKCKE